jgi:hypothetical protein
MTAACRGVNPKKPTVVSARSPFMIPRSVCAFQLPPVPRVPRRASRTSSSRPVASCGRRRQDGLAKRRVPRQGQRRQRDVVVRGSNGQDIVRLSTLKTSQITCVSTLPSRSERTSRVPASSSPEDGSRPLATKRWGLIVGAWRAVSLDVGRIRRKVDVVGGQRVRIGVRHRAQRRRRLGRGLESIRRRRLAQLEDVLLAKRK